MDITVQVIPVPLGNIIRTQVFDVGSDQRQSPRSFFAAEHVLRLECVGLRSECLFINLSYFRWLITISSSGGTLHLSIE